MEKTFCEYFQDLFTISNLGEAHIKVALQTMAPKVTPEMNLCLEQPFTVEEITIVLFQMCPTKAPGPDGLQAVFFQKHWEAVKDGVLATCLYVLNEQGTIVPLNHTYVALIPKTAKPKKVIELRPISLCNVIYRLIAKAIANRLK